VDTRTVHRALTGESGIDFTDDYRGVEVLSAYSGFDIDGHVWAVMAEKDVAEVQADAAGDRRFLSGLMLFLYGLSLWSVWFVRSSDAGESKGGGAVEDLMNQDLPEG